MGDEIGQGAAGALTVTSGPASGQTHEVAGDVVIGREGADLTIADPELSRRHAVLRTRPDGIEVEDLGSTNGTFVDGRRLRSPTLLTGAAALRLGTTEIALSITLPAAEPSTGDVASIAATRARPIADVEATQARAIPDIEATRARPIADVEATAARPIPDIEATAPRAIPDVEATAARAIPDIEATAARAIPDIEATAPRAIPDIEATRSHDATPVGGPPLKRSLQVIWGPDAGRTIPIGDRGVVIGRDSDDLQILDSELSRRHVAIRPAPGGVIVEDLNSTNGTYLNRKRITGAVTVNSPALLQLGKSEIAIELEQPGATVLRSVLPTQNSRAVAVFDPRSAVALQESEAEAVEAAVEHEAEPTFPGPHDLPKLPPLPAIAARFGITDQNRRYWVLTACCAAVAMSSLDTTVINVALPTMGRQLHIGLSGLEWTVNAYTLALAVLLVTGGRLGDVYGRRTTFVFGVVLFAISSMVVGASQNSTMLIASRSVQGIGAAFMTPGTLAIIASAFPLADRGKAIGAWAGISGIALAFGPVVGGLLTQHVSWRAVFYINVPVAIIAILVTAIAVPQSRDEGAERGLDLLGNTTLTLSLVALLVGLIQVPTWGWTGTPTLLLFAGTVVGLTVFVFNELHVKVPMLDFAALASPQFIGASLAGFAAFFVMLGMLVYTAVYMQSILGYSAFGAGIRFLPGTVLIAIVAPRSGRLIGRVNPRYIIAGGLICVAGAAFGVTFITPTTGYAVLLPSMVLIGVGIGAILPPMSASAIMNVRRGKAGLGAGVLNMSRQLGGAFGVAIIGTIFQSLQRSNIKHNLAALGLPAKQAKAIADAGVTGSTHAAGHLTAAKAHAITTAVHRGLVDALATAHYVPTGVALAGVAAVLLLVERRKAAPVAAPETAPAAAH